MAKTVRTQTRGRKAVDAISTALQTRTPFVTGGALSGVLDKVDTRYSQLPHEWKWLYDSHGNITYTVLSYQTPIAFYDADREEWVEPDVKYSVTTTKHQRVVGLALHYTGEARSSEWGSSED